MSMSKYLQAKLLTRDSKRDAQVDQRQQVYVLRVQRDPIFQHWVLRDPAEVETLAVAQPPVLLVLRSHVGLELPLLARRIRVIVNLLLLHVDVLTLNFLLLLLLLQLLFLL